MTIDSPTPEVSKAFTLMEVLLAVAISAIVLAAINTIFFGALRLRARTTETVEQTLPINRMVATIKRDLLGVVPPGALAGPMASDTTAVGMSQPVALEFYTTTGVVNDDAPWGDVQKIDYSLQAPTNRTASSGRDLIRSVTRNLLATTPETPEAQLLVSDVQALRFAYYDGTNWNDSWSLTVSNIPAAIKIFVTFAPTKAGQILNTPVQFLVPIVSQSRTNQAQNTN